MTEALSDCAHVACPHCLAPVNTRCRNIITGKLMTAPHYHRIQAADRAAEAEAS